MRPPEPERRAHAPPGGRLLAGLTPEQAQAVTYGTGPLLLIAAPRGGKTRILTHRVGWILADNHRVSVQDALRASGPARHAGDAERTRWPRVSSLLPRRFAAGLKIRRGM